MSSKSKTRYVKSTTKKPQSNISELHTEAKKTIDAVNQYYQQIDKVLIQKEESINQMTESMKKYDFKDGSIIKLNVGGKKFNVLKETLCVRIKKNQKINKKDEQEEENYYPEHMLSAMRVLKCQYILPIKDEYALKCLYVEAHYYQMEGLMEELESVMPSIKALFDMDSYSYFSGSKILTHEQMNQINSWCGNNEQQWNLLWQGTRDGFDANTFHNKCDNKGPTVTVIKTTCGSVFGGYTRISWSRNENYGTDNTAFLFSLSSQGKNTSLKFQISQNRYDNYAIYCSSNNGPIFGKNHDLTVSNKSVTASPNYYNYNGNSLQFNSSTIEEIEVYNKK
ncbi:hypothetical protein ABK040_016373 [Willaertia magna]